MVQATGWPRVARMNSRAGAQAGAVTRSTVMRNRFMIGSFALVDVSSSRDVDHPTRTAFARKRESNKAKRAGCARTGLRFSPAVRQRGHSGAAAMRPYFSTIRPSRLVRNRYGNQRHHQERAGARGYAGVIEGFERSRGRGHMEYVERARSHLIKRTVANPKPRRGIRSLAPVSGRLSFSSSARLHAAAWETGKWFSRTFASVERPLASQRRKINPSPIPSSHQTDCGRKRSMASFTKSR